jgi:hypothetical protein
VLIVPSKSFPVKEVRIESITPLCRIVLSFSISLTANGLLVIGCPAKFVLLGRQIDRKIVGIPIQQESWPTIDRAWCTIRVRTFTDYPVGDPHILGVQWLSAVQKFRFLIYDYESNKIY